MSVIEAHAIGIRRASLRKGRAGKRSQRGIAFVLVLWVIAMLSIILGSFSVVARTENLQARHLFDATQARYAAEAGLNLAVYELRKTDPAERWVGDGRPYRFGYGTAEIEVAVTDDSGKIDLNANNNDAILTNLFVSRGLALDQAEALAAAIHDWKDQELRNVVRMEFAHAFPQGNHPFAGRLDHDLTFGFRLDVAIPAVDRFHRCQKIHAGRKALFHQSACERRAVSIGRQRCQNNHIVVRHGLPPPAPGTQGQGNSHFTLLCRPLGNETIVQRTSFTACCRTLESNIGARPGRNPFAASASNPRPPLFFGGADFSCC